MEVDNIDNRSKVVANEELYRKKDGGIDKHSAAVKSGDVKLNKDGKISKQSKAVRSGDLKEKETTDLTERRNITEKEKEAAWNKAGTVKGKDPEKYRKDNEGNEMYHGSYGKKTEMGWEIDHSRPLKEHGTYHPNNLHALQTDANRSKSGKYH